MRQPFVDAMLKVFRETLVNSFEYLERWILVNEDWIKISVNWNCTATSLIEILTTLALHKVKKIQLEFS